MHGHLPDWLSGTLLRNGPAKFEAGTKSFRHWFDGQAMVHRFAISGGTVSYRNRFLDTASSRSVRVQGKITYPEFATDPCSSLFGRFFTRFNRKLTPNAAVNITPLGEDRMVALTETPLPVEFSPSTLDTVGVVGYQDDLSGQTTTAHPHRDPETGEWLNYVLKFGRKSKYQVYRQGSAPRRELVATVEADRPAYMHSFGVGGRYLVLTEFPLVVNPLALLLSGRPFIENFRWQPERGAWLTVVDLRDGTVAGRYQTDPFFAFHHINAYADGGELVVDLCAYPDAEIVSALYLDALRGNGTIPIAYPTRYRIDLDGTTGVRVERLAEEPLELPRIAYGRYNGRPYRFAYGAGARGRSGADFNNQLVKVDVTSGECRTWDEEGCYPGEPVFVAEPGAAAGDADAAEDAGVLLSVVLDPRASSSYLLVLDARSFIELARAVVPHPIPFGFHGHFTRSDASA